MVPIALTSGPLAMRVTEAFVQHWIGDQWMLHATVTLTNQTTRAQDVGPESLDAEGPFPGAMLMAPFPSARLDPQQSITGEVAWAPIMGVGYYVNLVQWSKGEYANPSNTERVAARVASRMLFSIARWVTLYSSRMNR